MKAFRIFGLTALLIMSMAVASHAANIKIGVVDFQKVLKESKAGKAAKEEIERKGKSIEGKLKKKGEAIEKMKKKLEAEAMVMSKDKREKKEREFRIEYNDFKTLQKKYAKDFKKFEAGVIRQVQKEVFELVGTLGKKGKFDLIVERGTALYYPDASDITDQLIKAYNAKK